MQPPPSRHLEFCRQAYFVLNYFGRIAEFGEDNLNHSRKYFTTAVLTLNFDLDLRKINRHLGQMLNSCVQFHENPSHRRRMGRGRGGHVPP